jgi:hypothetical protein
LWCAHCGVPRVRHPAAGLVVLHRLDVKSALPLQFSPFPPISISGLSQLHPTVSLTNPMTEIVQLPPLILHPFSGGHGADDLVDGSLASLALQGLVASSEEEYVLRRRMLAGRYQEVRMLLFLGKDIFRWLSQCVEHMQDSNTSDGQDRRIVEQSFSALVVEDPPEAVCRKLQGWGVTDRRAVFSRAIGIHSLFQEPPPFDSLSPIFLKNYHRYADHSYICFQHSNAFLELDGTKFQFELYASEEYARLLSDGWNLA